MEIFILFLHFFVTFAHFVIQKHKVTFITFDTPKEGKTFENSSAFFCFVQQNKLLKVFLGATRFFFTQVFTSAIQKADVALSFLRSFELEKFAFKFG